MNEIPQSVPANSAPDIPAAPAAPVTASANPAPVAMNPAPVAPAPASDIFPASANPAPVAVNPPPAAPVAVEPDYRAMYENLRRENEILRQNAETAQRSPVQAVSGGGVVNVPNDDFIRGFDSDTW